MLKINRAKRRWTKNPNRKPTITWGYPSKTAPLRPSSLWPIGTMATMLNCYHTAPVTGKVVSHTAYTVTIRTRSGLISGGTELMVLPNAK